MCIGRRSPLSSDWNYKYYNKSCSEKGHQVPKEKFFDNFTLGSREVCALPVTAFWDAYFRKSSSACLKSPNKNRVAATEGLEASNLNETIEEKQKAVEEDRSRDIGFVGELVGNLIDGNKEKELQQSKDRQRVLFSKYPTRLDWQYLQSCKDLGLSDSFLYR